MLHVTEYSVKRSRHLIISSIISIEPVLQARRTYMNVLAMQHWPLASEQFNIHLMTGTSQDVICVSKINTLAQWPIMYKSATTNMLKFPRLTDQ